jgi:hypothetical protein
MKYLVLLLSFACTAVFAQPIRVQGIGDTFQQAKENAFKTAIELQIGSVLVSEAESKDNKLVRNEIVNYSAGHVDNYTIVSVSNHNGKTVIIVDVQVSSSKIADRILGTSTNPKLFDSDTHATRYETYMKSKQDGDRILKLLLDDYPKRAFIVTQQQHRFGVDTMRNAFIEVGFKFNWNYNYIQSFNEALSLIQDGSNGMFKTSPGNIIVMAKNPNDWVLGKKNHFKFNDTFITETIKNRFENNIPRLKLTAHSQSNDIYFAACYVPDSFTGKRPGVYSMGETLIIYGNQVENNIIRVYLTNMNEALRTIGRLELTVVEHESCK